MYHAQRFLLSAAILFCITVSVAAQVTTSTLVGLVRDAQNAVIPGATVVATHEGTGVSREGVSDANGEFVFSALPAGPYTVKVELTGFKALQNRGMQLGAGQTVRQSFTLEVGAMAETITVAGEAPLIETAASLQADTVGSQEVRELPVSRRNLNEPDELDHRRQHERRRHGADERRCRGWHGDHRRWNRSELESRGAIDVAVRRAESDFRDEPRLGLRGADRQRRAACGVWWRRRRPNQRDQPVGHQQLPRFGVLQRSERKMERAQLFFDGAAARRHVQPVRRHAWWSGAAKQGVFLCDLRRVQGKDSAEFEHDCAVPTRA